MEFTVRPGRADEAEQISRLAAATFPAACPPEMTDQAIQAFIGENLSATAVGRYLTDPDFQVMVAEDADGPLLGYTLVDARPTGDPEVRQALDGRDAVCLSKMYVAEAARGHGVSTELMRRTLGAVQEQGHRSVWLGVNRQNVRANAFYERLGFRIRGERWFRVGDLVGHDHIRVIEL